MASFTCPPLRPSAQSHRVLLGAAAIDGPAERACSEFANTPDGSARIAAMSQRALGSLVRDDDGEVVAVDAVARILAVNSLFSSALGGHDQIQGDAFDRVVRAAAATAQATTFELACQRAADAALEVSQLSRRGAVCARQRACTHDVRGDSLGFIGSGY